MSARESHFSLSARLLSGHTLSSIAVEKHHSDEKYVLAIPPPTFRLPYWEMPEQGFIIVIPSESGLDFVGSEHRAT